MPFLDLGTHRIHYQVHNPHDLTTRPLVLLHGLGSSGDDWLLQLTAFAQHNPVITLDLRGHGRSSIGPGWPAIAAYAEDVAQLVSELDLGPVHVLGLSLGGMVALQLALDRPECVRSLMIVNACARLQVGWRGWFRTLGRIFLLAIGRMDWLGAWIAAGIFPDPAQRDWRQAAAERITGNPRNSYARALWAVARFNSVPRLGELRIPTLIVAGDRDTTISLDSKQLLAERIQGCRLVRLPESGHATPYDASESFNPLVLGFLDEVERSGANPD